MFLEQIKKILTPLKRNHENFKKITIVYTVLGGREMHFKICLEPTFDLFRHKQVRNQSAPSRQTHNRPHPRAQAP